MGTCRDGFIKNCHGSMGIANLAVSAYF
jgi:hypothetical protein